MCTNYRPSSRDLLESYFDVAPAKIAFRDEVYPSHEAPIIRLAQENGKTTSGRECVPAVFGLIPIWSKDGKNFRHTYNARTETVCEKPSYRNAWKKRQFCIVPMDAFYEPNYETGKPVRWRIEREDHAPFGVAAIYDYWKSPSEDWITSFSLLTVNADDHPVMHRFHPPGDEKRSIVAIDPAFYDDWLKATTDEALSFFAPIAANAFTTVPDPKATKAKLTPSSDAAAAE
jgi:putative SOS response-associated peptidase YedK